MGGPGLLAGRTLGEFVLIERIGRGASGSVYRARQAVLERDAVVKVLHRPLRSSPAAVEQFTREARLASRVDHPYAAHVYAHGAEPDGTLWIAMELVRGVPLDELLRSGGPIPVARFVAFFDRLCEVVETAHGHGIVHGDLKPANVMVLARAGRWLPKLLDLGVASLRADGDAGRSSDAAPRGAIGGTPAYRAPELWGDSPAATTASDLYALGVLAYEALAGRLPFSAAERPALARDHQGAPIPSLGAAFAVALDEVLARALAKRPDDRPRSALELAAQLRAAAALALDDAALPQLDESVRQGFLAQAPQPIAEAIATLEAARSADRALRAAGGVVTTMLRYLGAVALASRAHVAPRAPSPAVAARFAGLRRGVIDDAGWLELIVELLRPFESTPDAHPMPELVAAFYPAGGRERAPLGTLLAELLALVRQEQPPHPHALEVAPPASEPALEISPAAANAALIDRLTRALPVLATCLRSATFLADYALIVPRAGRHEHWMGLRRPERPIAPAEVALPDGRAVLIDAYGRPAVSLWPLVEVAAPAPGLVDELFLLEGRGRRGMLRVARPVPHERDDPDAWEAIGRAILGAADDERDAPSERPPYRGLAAFSRSDAGVFFGRERETEAFVNRLRVDALLAIVGPSGVGKSSFVQAGVIPALPAGWWAVTARPGGQPIASLVAQLAHDGIAVPGGAAAVEHDPAVLGAALAGARHGVCVLVIDQFEELFTHGRDPADRERFCRALVQAAGDERIRVVVTLRDDFLVRAGEIAALRDRLGPGLHVLTTPLAADLLRIVREPARSAGYAFDDDALPAEMVEAVVDRPAALPLLSFTGSKLWELRDPQFRQLTRKAYAALGGVVGALARHAEDTLAALPADDRPLVRRAFRHLVMADGTRARMTRRELGEVLGSARAEPLVERLIDARLLQAYEGAAGDAEDHIELVHEALLLAWPRLVEWRREDAESARMRDGLRAAARQWESRGGPRGLLWRDEALAEYRLWRARFPGALTAVESSFAAASLGEAARGQRIRRIAIAAAFVAIASVAALLFRTSQIANSRLAMLYEEQGRQLAVAGDPARGLVYLAEAAAQGADSGALAFTISAARRTMSNQRLVLAGTGAGLWDAQISPDGTRIVTAGEDGTAVVWDATTGRSLHRLDGHTGPLRAAQFSPDGARIATASDDRTARVWDAASGALLATLTGHEGRVWRATYSADGAHLMTHGNDSTLRIWDARTLGLRHVQRAAGAVLSAAFSADGGLVAETIAGRGTTIFDAATGKLVRELPSGDDSWVVAFSPDGRRLATGSARGTLRVWDRDTGLAGAQPAGHRSAVLGVAFSPDGQRILSAGNDGIASLWDAATGAPIVSVTAHGSGLHTAELTRDGARLLTTANDGVAQVWDARTGALIASMMGHVGLIRQGRFSPDGSRVVTASVDGTARVWEPRDPALLSAFEVGVGDPAMVTHVRASGSAAVFAATERTAVVWDLGQQRVTSALTRERIVGMRADAAVVAVQLESNRVAIVDVASGTVLATLSGHTGAITRAAFGASGRVATASRDRTVRIWEESRAVATLEHPAEVQWVELSSDGARLVTTAGDGRARVWSADGRPVATSPRVDQSLLNAARFDRPARRVVTAGIDGTARIWDLERGTYVATLRGHQNFLFDAAFSPDGARVASSSFDRTVKLWDAASGKLLASLDTGLVASLDLGDDRLVTGGNDGRVALWDVSTMPRAAETLRSWLPCHVALVLDGGALAPAPLPACP